MWTSVDPAGQFDSPYSYTGNVYNPINGVDPDGNAFGVGDAQYLASSWARFENRGVIMSSAENARAFANHRLSVDFADIIKSYGYDAAVKRGFLPKMNGDIYDALRHAAWSMELAGKLGVDEAKIFLNDFHERPGNDSKFHRQMDIDNNTAAIEYWNLNNGRDGVTNEILVNEMESKGLLKTIGDYDE
jgi:hypothetical protein